MPEYTIKKLLIESTDYLQQKGVENARFDAENILAHYLNISRSAIYLGAGNTVGEIQITEIKNAIIERGNRKPLQYILGFVEFCGCYIEVNADVLIPRPETEFMVDLILQSTIHYQLSTVNCQLPTVNCQLPTILDLCTGSGAIAIAMKKKIPKAAVYASDICEKALEIARKNARYNDSDILFIQSDLFENNHHRFDLIISNPPYVSEAEYHTSQPEIFFEPAKALIAGNDGLYFYERIINKAKQFLKKNGVLYLEIGSEQTEKIKKIVNKIGTTELDIYKDLSNKDRIARIKY